MYQYISHCCCQGSLRPPGENEKGGGDGHNFPEDIKRENIPCKTNSQRSAGIKESGTKLEVIINVKGKNNTEKCNDAENVSEDPA